MTCQCFDQCRLHPIQPGLDKFDVDQDGLAVCTVLLFTLCLAIMYDVPNRQVNFTSKYSSDELAGSCHGGFMKIWPSYLRINHQINSMSNGTF